MKLTKIQQVIKSIGEFYLQKHNGDARKANKEIDDLRITKIEFYKNQYLNIELEDRITITTMRPGFLIGAKGINIENLSKYIGKNIHIVEEIDLGFLYSYEYKLHDLEDSDFDFCPCAGQE